LFAKLGGSYALGAVVLFLVWSNSFVAASFLLGSERFPARFDYAGLSVARFAPVGPLCLLYCFFFRFRESIRILRQHPWRLGIGSLLAVPAYNLSLYYGQEHGVPPPVASLTTALTPLFVLLLAAVFLNERLTVRRLAAFLIALSGLVIIALSRGGLLVVGGYGLTLAITALAPLSWSIYSILSKPATTSAPPLTWTYLAIGLGSIPLLLLLPWVGGPEMLALSLDGWVAVLYLSIFCTLFGYAMWVWLLHHLPASTVGFAVFLNPPFTTVSKLVLAAAFPAVFVWQMNALEWLGGGLALLGVAIAVWPSARKEAP
jgi:O-acetylserine/cysteine efflux transporter